MSKKRREGTPDLLSQIAGAKTSYQDDSVTVVVKTKCTYYFLEDIADRFDYAWMEMRKATRDRSSKLTKSELAQLAITELLDRLDDPEERQKIVDLLS